ncbi:hypothetical protein LJB94_01430 [Odoribacter sp. OttesenSCG-928-G04]|nr:hypothetical protein [Odoribacter sp. OttesenSCG-928-G04]MDL2331203.1 hypothetical protein [Odoribacter sp. OttesenSCG-928-A06]
MKKFLRRLLLILFIASVAFAIAVFALELLANRAIEKEIRKLTNSKVHFDVNRVHVSFINKCVRITDIHVRTLQDGRKNPEKKEALRYLELRIDELRFGGIDFGWFNPKKIKFHTLSVLAPNLVFEINTGLPSDKYASDKPEKTNIIDIVKRFKLPDITIRNGTVRYNEYEKNKDISYVVRGLNADLADIHFDSTSTYPLSDSDIKVSVAGFTHKGENKSLLLQTDSIILDVKNRFLAVNNMQLLPQYPKDQFAQKAKNNADWISFCAGRIECHEVDFESLRRDKRIEVDSVRISDSDISSYKNRKIHKIDPLKPLVYELVQRFPLKTTIRRVVLDTMNATYEELPKIGTLSGQITFNAMCADIYGLTNVVTSGQQYVKMFVRGKLQNAGMLHSTFYFPVDSLHDRFEIVGTLGSMDMLPLNRMIEPLTSVEIKSGKITGMDFHIVGNKKQAEIDLQLLYKDLQVSLLKGRRKRERVFISGLVNEFLLLENNPDHNGIRSVHSIGYRDNQRSSFNYLWKIFMPALKETIGLKDAESQRFYNKDRANRKNPGQTP